MKLTPEQQREQDEGMARLRRAKEEARVGGVERLHEMRQEAGVELPPKAKRAKKKT
jgi:hypothetical protein